MHNKRFSSVCVSRLHANRDLIEDDTNLDADWERDARDTEAP